MSLVVHLFGVDVEVKMSADDVQCHRRLELWPAVVDNHPNATSLNENILVLGDFEHFFFVRDLSRRCAYAAGLRRDRPKM
ncbi:hypothetical protein EVAR_82153_1 [Eumeta japonica]|uniref:Uncharacterized protein n=1 Tax=Eumeta variegata TaxID=151549 RepID=A0A4C1U1X0_EUMVA|nr:hypothetical protein EVAR_82153_1 [Eumeta japonica]